MQEVTQRRGKGPIAMMPVGDGGWAKWKGVARDALRVRRGWVWIIFAMVVIHLAFFVALSQWEEFVWRWKTNLNGVRMKDLGPGSCSIHNHYPLLDYLPRRLLNFWYSEDCRYPSTILNNMMAYDQMQGRYNYNNLKTLPKRMFSRMEGSLLIVDGCPPGAKIFYSLDPDWWKLLPAETIEVLSVYGRIRTDYLRTKTERNFTYTKPVEIHDSEVIRVFCKYKTEPSMLQKLLGGEGDYIMEENLHVQNLVKYDALQERGIAIQNRTKNRRARNVDKTASETNQERKSSEEQTEDHLRTERPNILMLMYDSLSWAHFKRRLPKSIEKMEFLSRHPDYHFFQFFRYHIVGRTTRNNLTPLFRGHFYPSANEMRKFDFFWKKFEDNGYLTLYLLAACCDYFQEYWSTEKTQFYHEFTDVFCHPDYADEASAWGARCIAGKQVHDLAIDYLKQYLNNHNPLAPTLSIVQFSDAHERSYAPIQLVDDGLEEFLDWMHVSGKLNNTILMVFADHGCVTGTYYDLFGSIRAEHRLPMFYSFFPKWFIDKYPNIYDTLKANEHKLITAFDWYRTLHHLLTYPNEPEFNEHSAKYYPFDNFNISKPTPTKDTQIGGAGSYKPPNSYSLISEIVPPTRSCEDARIPGDFCICNSTYNYGNWWDARYAVPFCYFSGQCKT